MTGSKGGVKAGQEGKDSLHFLHCLTPSPKALASELSVAFVEGGVLPKASSNEAEPEAESIPRSSFSQNQAGGLGVCSVVKVSATHTADVRTGV